MRDDIEKAIQQATPAAIARLFAIATDEDGSLGLTDEDLAGILQYQLDSPVPLGVDGVIACQSASKVAGQDALVLRELLEAPQGREEILDRVKAWTRGLIEDPDPLPSPVSRVLYFCCLAAALVGLGQRMTSLHPEAIVAGMVWVTEQDWADPLCRDLATQAQIILGSELS